MKLDLIRPAMHGLTFADEVRLAEQSDYLEGVLWADRDRRLNPEADPRDIDQHGHGTAAFWRGMLESSGYVAMTGTGERRYPRVELRAAYPVLRAFLDFIQERVHTYQGIQWVWDADGKLDFQAAGGKVSVTGTKAQEVCRALYIGQEVGMESIRRTVDEILTWTSKR